jgi:hypothetical protein
MPMEPLLKFSGQNLAELFRSKNFRTVSCNRSAQKNLNFKLYTVTTSHKGSWDKNTYRPAFQILLKSQPPYNTYPAR